MDIQQAKIHGSQQAIYHATLSANIEIFHLKSMQKVDVQPLQLKTDASTQEGAFYRVLSLALPIDGEESSHSVSKNPNNFRSAAIPWFLAAPTPPHRALTKSDNKASNLRRNEKNQGLLPHAPKNQTSSSATWADEVRQYVPLRTVWSLMPRPCFFERDIRSNSSPFSSWPVKSVAGLFRQSLRAVSVETFSLCLPDVRLIFPVAFSRMRSVIPQLERQLPLYPPCFVAFKNFQQGGFSSKKILYHTSPHESHKSSVSQRAGELAGQLSQ